MIDHTTMRTFKETKNSLTFTYSNGSAATQRYNDNEIPNSQDGISHWKQEVSSFKNSKKWTCGDHGYEQTINDIKTGICTDNQLVEFIRDIKSELGISREQRLVKKRRRKFNEYDGDFNIDRAMGASPDYYEKKTRVDRKHRVKTFYINLAISCGFTANQYKQRLATFIGKLNREIEKGSMVKVVLTLTVRSLIKETEKKYSVNIVAKEFSQPFDFHRLAVVAYSGYYRGLGFALWIKDFYKFGRFSSGLGTAINMHEYVSYLKEINEGDACAYNIQDNTFKDLQQ